MKCQILFSVKKKGKKLSLICEGVDGIYRQENNGHFYTKWSKISVIITDKRKMKLKI